MKITNILTNKFSSDLKKLPESKLQKVAEEVREEMIDAVSITEVI